MGLWVVGGVLTSADSLSEAMVGLREKMFSLLLLGSEGSAWRAQVPLEGSEGAKMLSICEGGMLPWVGARAAVEPWLVGVHWPSSWFYLLLLGARGGRERGGRYPPGRQMGWGRQSGEVEGKGADGGCPLEAAHMEEPGECEEHSQRQHWFLPLKDGHSQCQSLLWARHRAELEIPGPGLCGNPREGHTFSNRGRQPCPWTDTQKELPKPQTERGLWWERC